MNHVKQLQNKIIIGLVIFFTALPAIAEENPYEIMKKNHALKQPQSVKNTSVMFILQGNSKDVKEFNLLSKKVHDQIRMRLTITKPINLDFISWSVPGKGAKQWINMGKNFTQIGSSEMHGSFLGSHFTFADLSEPYLDDHIYTYLGDAKVNGEDCYKIQANRKENLSVYKKTVLYIRKKDYYMVQVDFYEKKGHTKSLNFEKIEIIDGIITARKITMAKTNSKNKTIIILKNIEYNVPISDNVLIPVSAYQN